MAGEPEHCVASDDGPTAAEGFARAGRSRTERARQSDQDSPFPRIHLYALQVSARWDFLYDGDAWGRPSGGDAGRRGLAVSVGCLHERGGLVDEWIDGVHLR